MIRTFNKKAILNRINALERVTPSERLINAFLVFNNGKYELDCRLWNGINGSGIRSVMTIHDSFEDAEREFEDICNKYPSKEDVILFVDDLEEELIFMDDDSYREILKDISNADLEAIAFGNLSETELKNIIKKGLQV